MTFILKEVVLTHVNLVYICDKSKKKDNSLLGSDFSETSSVSCKDLCKSLLNYIISTGGNLARLCA